MSKRKERMRQMVEKGHKAFIIKEGLYHFGLKLWLLYMAVSFFISYDMNPSYLFTPGELIRSGLYLLVFMAIGLYWGFIWYHVHASEKKREKEQEENRKKNKKKSNS